MRAPRSNGFLTALSGVTLLVASTAAAHPGHGLDSSATGLFHFVLELSHGGSGLVALVALAVIVTAMTGLRRRD